MKTVLNVLLANKRYVGLALGGLVMLAQHAGISIPGASLDQTSYMADLKDAAYVVALAYVSHHDGKMAAQ